jgi:hypothetical protein
MYSEPVVKAPPMQAFVKILALIGLSLGAGWVANRSGIAPDTLPVISVCTFAGVICTTLFFWTHRVAVAFLACPF